VEERATTFGWLVRWLKPMLITVMFALKALGIDPGLNCTKYTCKMEKKKSKDIDRKTQFYLSSAKINFIAEKSKALREKKNKKAQPMNRVLV
jgi:hypothetical protein